MQSYSIKAIGDGEPVPAGDLRTLHFSLLPHSPVVLLGPRFVEHFYYPKLVEMGLLFGAIAYWDDRPVGFIAVTQDASGFMGRAIKRHPIKLAWTMLVSVLADPRRLAALYEALQIMRNREPAETSEPVAELLSFGVIEEFRSAGFARKTGVKVGRDLFGKAIEQLRERGVATVAALVDQDNKEVCLMYRAMGWTVHDPDVKGWKTPQIEFRTRLRGDQGED